LTPNQRSIILAEKGEILLAEGNASEAVDVLAEAAKLTPAESSIHFALSRALSSAGQPRRARQHADILRKIKTAEDRMTKITNRVIESPDDADLRCEAASVLIDQGLKREAVGWLVSALKCDPAHHQAHQLLGEYCEETGNQKLAAQLHLFKGSGLLREGRLLDALEEFGHAKNHPDVAASALALSGEALYKARQFGDAVRILDRALQLDPSQTDARRWLAATYHDIGAMDHALKHLQMVADQAPTDPRPHRLIGLMHKDFEAYAEAIAAYRESLRRNPDQPDQHKIRTELAECQIRLRQHVDALETLGKCPKSAERFALEAECHYAQRDASSARKAVSQALELQPDHLEAMQLAATMDLEEEDAESSVRILRQAVEHHPREFRVRYQLAQAYGRLGERELAEEQMRQMQELRKLHRRFTDLHEKAIKDADDVEARYQLGVLADQLGKPELARTWFAATLGMDPNHEGAQKALASALEQPPPAPQDDAGNSP